MLDFEQAQSRHRAGTEQAQSRHRAGTEQAQSRHRTGNSFIGSRLIAGLVSCIMLGNIISCNANFLSDNNETIEGFAGAVRVWNDAGLISDYPVDSGFSSSRSISAVENNESDQVFVSSDVLIAYQNIVSDPETSLALYSKEKDGYLYLAIFDAIANGETVGEVLDKMEQVSPEMAASFESSVHGIVADDNDSAGAERSLKHNNIRNIKLSMPLTGESVSRAIGDFDWGNIGAYVCLSVAAIAGLTAYKFAPWLAPWVKAAGLIAAGVAVAGMSVYLGYWAATNSTFMSTVVKIFNNGNFIITGDFALQFSTVMASTAAVGVYAYAVTPELVSFVYAGTVNLWNALIAHICAYVPAGVTVYINGVKLAPLDK